MAAAVPENVMVASVVPSPVVKVRPAIPESENVPLVTATVTVRRAGIDIGDGDQVAVGHREDARGIFCRGLGSGDGVGRGVVDGEIR